MNFSREINYFHDFCAVQQQQRLLNMTISMPGITFLKMKKEKYK